jgi:serine/threonine-protein kinase
MFPLIVPCPPRRTLVTALIAASTAPLGLLVVEAAGVADVTADNLLSISFSPFIAVSIAYVGSKVVYGLGREVAEARRMGSYQLEQLLGRGGMGEVWVAHHRLLARPAAVKLVRPDVVATAVDGASRIMQRFEREAQATAAMRSPHTINLYDYGVASDGTFYYVMELLDGLTADALVRRFGPVPAERAVYLLTQICHSLAEAHDAGLVHRDIKPANVYVCRYGRDVDFVKVLDFGLVKTLASPSDLAPEADLTGTNVISGTPAYMAPEQVLGRAQDARSDIYAVGCVGYWLLTGQRVFDGDTAMALAMHHAATPALAPSTRTELPIPAALDAAILSCLAKDPAARPQSASQLSDLLVASVPPGRWPQTRARQWWTEHQPATPG